MSLQGQLANVINTQEKKWSGSARRADGCVRMAVVVPVPLVIAEADNEIDTILVSLFRNGTFLSI